MAALNAKRARLGVARREKYVEPQHRDVWVRIGGRWRKGKIAWWVTKPGWDRWECVIGADEPVDRPWPGRYVYDPRAIRPRHSDSPPDVGGLALG